LNKFVTIISDWNNADFYLGSVKAAIISSAPNVSFIDVNNNIESFNYVQAAFVLKSIYKNFPDGTIHILAVNSELDENEHFAVVKENNQYFIANDNGIFGLIFSKNPELVVKIYTGKYFQGSTFPEFSVFADIVSYIANDNPIENLGEIVDDVNRKSELLPQIEPNEITGKVIHIDSYQNAITNISKSFFDNYVANNEFEISLDNNQYKINKIVASYKDVDSGNILCLFNSLGLLEFAVREGKAAQMFKLSTRSQIRIKF